MTDRELLEKVAHVFGLAYEKFVNNYDDGRGGTDQGLLYWTPQWGARVWNPLTDDGDALRLAVKLKMRVTVDDDWSGAGWTENQSAPTFDGRGPWGWKEWHYPMTGPDAGRVRDPYAATRRAIVRAAASMADKS